MVEEGSRSEEENETGPGTGAFWLPEDDCNGPLSVEIDELWRRDALELHYPWVPDDYPVRRHFTEPAPHMEHLTLKPLTKEELAAYDYFSSVDYDITFEDGRVVRSKEPSTWLPHTKYIFGDRPLSALLLSPLHENGLDYLDFDALGVDNDYRPLTVHLPAPPTNYYLNMHSSTNGRRGGNRHGPQNLRRRGRDASTSTRVPVVAATSAANSPAIPPRSSATRTVTRGGTLNRRHSREQTLEDSAANKRQAVENPDTSAMNEVQIEDLDPSITEVQDEGATAIGAGTTGGGSLVSQTTSSIKEMLRELIATPSFLSNLSPGIFYRFREWIEKKEVPLSDAVAAAFAPQAVTPGKIYQPNWDVREDESLYSDIRENRWHPCLPYSQGYANNAAIELIEQYLEYQRLADTYKASLETCQGLLKDAEDKLAPLEDEVVTLREMAALLEETEENVKILTKAVEAANSEKDMAILDAFAAEARGAAKAVADFKGSDDYVAELHKRYDGGWAAAMRCVCKTVPSFDWNISPRGEAAEPLKGRSQEGRPGTSRPPRPELSRPPSKGKHPAVSESRRKMDWKLIVHPGDNIPPTSQKMETDAREYLKAKRAAALQCSASGSTPYMKDPSLRIPSKTAGRSHGPSDFQPRQEKTVLQPMVYRRHALANTSSNPVLKEYRREYIPSQGQAGALQIN
ncbi:hypothetical protein BVRB_4g084400 [Beta vulgaris subsp. vulgaris]|uniref:Uncharacterized protein n=1 Tax=Beta vulgaris subsp. vulgaris TaxID=3555 RepID=A0A0J8CMV0_BETVV|nr:hypothetical protein BVRB_4g084400 [Beta vulgaris subsp. vulgaris]